ncbi:MAG: Uma2 family endonuclease [Planctomycetaceae bacterium]
MSDSSQTIRKSPTKLTYNEYVLFPDDGKRHEVIDGRHYCFGNPNPRHQYVSRHILFQLYEQIELRKLGEVINSPIDLQLSLWDVVQPDIAVVLTANRIITTTKIKGVPDLVIEILSPSNRKHDLELKNRLYEQSGVPEYWIVDPENQSVTQYRLGEDSTFANPVVFTESITFEGIPGGAVVDLEASLVVG